MLEAQMRNRIKSQKILQQNHQQFYMFDTYAYRLDATWLQSPDQRLAYKLVDR